LSPIVADADRRLPLFGEAPKDGVEQRRPGDGHLLTEVR